MIPENKTEKGTVENRNLFQILAQKIEGEVENGPVRNWTQRDFASLHRAILEKTGGNISITTLKRILGKVEYSGLPYVHTLNILARFTGFAHWEDFLKKNKPGQEKYPEYGEGENKPSSKYSGQVRIPEAPEKITFPKSKFRFRAEWIAIGFVLLSIGWISGAWYQRKQKAGFAIPANIDSPGKLRYTASNPDTLPRKVQFLYSGPVPDPSDLTVISCESGLMEYFHIGPEGFGQATHIYTKPGLYHTKIFSNNRQLAFCPVLIESNGWQFQVRGPRQEFRPSWKGVKGHYYIPPSVCRAGGIDTLKRYHTGFQKYQHFLVSGDSLELETEIRNRSVNPESEDCLLTLKIRCANMPIVFQIARWTPRDGFFVQISDKLFDSKRRKGFVYLQQSLQQWRKIRIYTKDKRTKVWIDNTLVLDETYKLPLGDVLGLEFDFVGSGEIKSLRMKEANRLVPGEML